MYAKDNSSVYVNDKKIPGADLASFNLLGENYARDGKHVFYKTKIVKGADPATFKVYPHDFGNADSEDARHQYHEGVKVKIR